jgi:hypothetical protein
MFTLPIGNTIKFWLNGQETFNEKFEPQMKCTPFYQKYNSTDEVRIQIQDTISSPYKLRLLDTNGSTITTLSFVQTFSNGMYIYDALFTFASLGVTNTKVKLQIITSAFFAEISGGISEPQALIEGSILFSSDEFSIDGGITESVGTVDGTIDVVLSYAFKFAETIFGTCAMSTVTLYFRASDGLNPGTVLYSDESLTTPYYGSDYVTWAGANIFNYTSGSGTIGSDTGSSC